jgi:ABC-2 type transport system ATP-binding protein
MPEQDCHIPGLTAVGFVAYAGELAGMPPNQALRRAHEVLEYCGLSEARYRNVETYSTGMKQRIKLAQALVHGPRLLLLDEPTNGLDPAGRDAMLDLIRDVSRTKGVSVLVCSHLLPDIERCCDRVILILRGHIQAHGSIRDLKRLDGLPVEVELREPSAVFEQELRRLGAEVEIRRTGLYRIYTGASFEDSRRVVFAAAATAGAQVRGFQPSERSLEDAFLEAVSK